MKLTPEMHQWLTDNDEDYELFLVHGMMHDPQLRAPLLSAPVLETDFRRGHYALVVEAISRAVEIMAEIGETLDCPPSPEFLRPYVESASRKIGSDDKDVEMAMKLLHELQDPKFMDQHYCIKPFFEAWYGSVRAKQAAKDIQMMKIPDVHGAVDKIQVALDAASEVVGGVDVREFRFAERPPPPVPILKLDSNIICTPGNISNIQGPPKACKTTVVEAVLAATLLEGQTKVDTLGFSGDSQGRGAVLHIDSEQSDHDHDAVVRRAYRRAGKQEPASWLRSFCITSMAPDRAWQFLSRKVKEIAAEPGGIVLIVIDGIADFCRDPNDSAECFELVRKLHSLARTYQCAILTVLHENPSSPNGKTRGHLGSQIERKAESSLRLSKDAKTGIVEMWTERSRHCFIPRKAGWRFHWCDDAKMHVSLHPEKPRSGESDKRAKYEDEVSRAFEHDETLSYKDLTTRVVKSATVADSTAKSRIPDYMTLGLIEKDADGRYRIVRPRTVP